MKILIVDERKGNVLRDPSVKEGADIIAAIELDGGVRVDHASYLPSNEVVIEFVEAVHRDVISAEQSEQEWQRQQAEKHSADDPKGVMTKVKRALNVK